MILYRAEYHQMMEIANHIYRSTRDEMVLPYISPFVSLLVTFVTFLLGGSPLLMGGLGVFVLIMIGVYNNIMDTIHMEEYRIRLYHYLDEHRNVDRLRRSPRLAERKIEEIHSYKE